MTNLIVVATSILTAWFWGDWKNWQKYHATMLYVALCNLLYAFIYYNHYLWYINPSFCGPIINEMCFTLVVFPLTSFLLLSNFPNNSIKKQIVHIAKYVSIYYAVECIYFLLGKITYNYGWTIWHSFFWLCGMFPLIVLHYKKPLIAYILSFLTVVLTLTLFPLNLF